MLVHFELQQFMHVAVAAINELFDEPKDVFWTGKAIDLLFNGIEIDCNVTNPLTKIACREIKKRKYPSFKHLDNNKFLFSMVGCVSKLFSVFVNFFTFFEMLMLNFSSTIHQTDAGKYIAE